MRTLSLPDWPAPNVTVSETGCWLWQRGRTGAGYGAFTIRDGDRRVTKLAHRHVFEVLRGNITGDCLDHLCRVRHCVNPEHLEPTSTGVNTLRGVGLAAVNAVKVTCPAGHPYDTANTYAHGPAGRYRGCRACRQAAAQRYRNRKRSLACV